MGVKKKKKFNYSPPTLVIKQAGEILTIFFLLCDNQKHKNKYVKLIFFFLTEEIYIIIS